MREIKVKVYKFAELSEEAKGYVRSRFREEDHLDLELSCERDSLKAIGNIIGKARYEVDAWNHVHVTFKPQVEEEVEEMLDVRLLRWIWNNWIEPNMKGKYYGKLIPVDRSEEHPAGYKHIKYYSHATLEWNCPLTGFCMDMVLFETYKTMEASIKRGERWNMSDFISELEDSFAKEWQDEIDYRNSDEYIDTHLSENDFEFYADGTSYKF